MRNIKLRGMPPIPGSNPDTHATLGALSDRKSSTVSPGSSLRASVTAVTAADWLLLLPRPPAAVDPPTKLPVPAAFTTSWDYL